MTETDKSDVELRDRAWELAQSIGTCMLITWDGERQRARPMAATVRKDERAIYFLTDKNSAKVMQARAFPMVSASFADAGGNKFVTMTGVATVEDDRTKIKDLWTPFAKAWWSSSDDPSIRLIAIKPDDAELWDSPGKLVASVVMLAAAVTGKTPSLGDTAKVGL